MTVALLLHRADGAPLSTSFRKAAFGTADPFAHYREIAWEGPGSMGTGRVNFTGELAVAEPRTFRYRILHIAGRLIRSARRRWLRLPEHWPWASDLLDAYRRLAAIA